jgi:TRAP-type C4-dicarboxylate transport system permease small subunit
MFAIGRALGTVIDLLTWIGAAAVMAMMFHVSIDVLGKYLFNAPLPATLEITSHYYMVACVFLPLGLVERQNLHISVEILTSNLPGAVERFFIFVAMIASLLYFGVMTYRTWFDALDKYSVGAFIMGSTSAVPTWPTYFMVPLGCGVMMAVLLYKILIYLTGAKSGLGETSGHKSVEQILEEGA